MSQVLDLALVRWPGSFQGISTTWLHWARLDGTLLSTTEERAEQAEQWAHQAQTQAEQAQTQADQAEERAEQAENKVMQIVRNLLQTGMTAAQVAQITGLLMAQVTALIDRP